MRLSKRTEQAIDMLVVLADVPQMTLAQLAMRTMTPKKTAEIVVAQLRRERLVTSKRGPRGGYRLARPAAEIRAVDIVEAIEGKLFPHHGDESPAVRRCKNMAAAAMIHDLDIRLSELTPRPNAEVRG